MDRSTVAASLDATTVGPTIESSICLRRPAVRPSWSGHLRLSLVSCPIGLVQATTEIERITITGGCHMNTQTVNQLTPSATSTCFMAIELSNTSWLRHLAQGIAAGDG